MKASWRPVVGKQTYINILRLQNFYILFSEKFFSKRDLVVEEMEETTAKLEMVFQLIAVLKDN